MTDNEIMKALNEADGLNHISIYCADSKGEYIASVKVSDIIDLINRKNAELESITEKFNCQQTVYADLSDIIRDKNEEIERLSDRNHKCIYLSDDETTEYCVDGPCPKFKTEAQIRAEAIKEFEERLKVNTVTVKIGKQTCQVITIEGIDYLVKEMVGDM